MYIYICKEIECGPHFSRIYCLALYRKGLPTLPYIVPSSLLQRLTYSFPKAGSEHTDAEPLELGPGAGESESGGYQDARRIWGNNLHRWGGATDLCSPHLPTESEQKEQPTGQKQTLKNDEL